MRRASNSAILRLSTMLIFNWSSVTQSLNPSNHSEIVCLFWIWIKTEICQALKDSQISCHNLGMVPSEGLASPSFRNVSSKDNLYLSLLISADHVKVPSNRVEQSSASLGQKGAQEGKKAESWSCDNHAPRAFSLLLLSSWGLNLVCLAYYYPDFILDLSAVSISV